MIGGGDGGPLIVGGSEMSRCRDAAPTAESRRLQSQGKQRYVFGQQRAAGPPLFAEAGYSNVSTRSFSAQPNPLTPFFPVVHRPQPPLQHALFSLHIGRVEIERERAGYGHVGLSGKSVGQRGGDAGLRHANAVALLSLDQAVLRPCVGRASRSLQRGACF